MTDDDLDVPRLEPMQLEDKPPQIRQEGVKLTFKLPPRNLLILSGCALAMGAGAALWLNASGASAPQRKTEKPAVVANGKGRRFDTSEPAAAGSSPALCPDASSPVRVKSSDGAGISTPDGVIMICADGTVITRPYAATQYQSESPPIEPLTTRQYEAGMGTRALRPVHTNDKSQSTPRKKEATSLFIPSPEPERAAPDAEIVRPRKEPLITSESSDAMQPLQATRLLDRDYLLPEGRLIECALSVRLISELAGQAVCILTRPVYSDTGRVLLLEAGTEVLGDYEAFSRPGQHRLLVRWRRIRSPSGVSIRFDGDATDSLGAAGLDGKVDNHWWQRVGSAFLLSFVQDAVSGATRKPQQGEIVWSQSGQTGQSMAEKVLDAGINLPPTLYRQQGDRALIYVNRDVSFKDVYRPNAG